MHQYIFIDESGSPQFYAKRKRPLWTEPNFVPIICLGTVVRSRDFPELSVVDYLLWALQRYIFQGEKRYFAAMAHHYEQILDIYEDDGNGRLYTREDQFELEKASPFKI